MNLQDIAFLYAKSPQIKALAKVMEDFSKERVFLEGLLASSSAMIFSSLGATLKNVCLFILNDSDEASYFYHDLVQILGSKDVLLFPSSFRRKIKYGQKDAANGILRTHVLSRLTKKSDNYLYIVTYPEAISEQVISKEELSSNTIEVKIGSIFDVTLLSRRLKDLGFKEVDYVYEPGEFAIRGSILDVFSFSQEYPYRIDFFGDEVESIRTFDLRTQLSLDKKEVINIVHEVSLKENKKVSFLSLLPKKTIIIAKDFSYIPEVLDKIKNEGFSSQAKIELFEGINEEEKQRLEKEFKTSNFLLDKNYYLQDIKNFRLIEIGPHPTIKPQTTLKFNFKAQPLFHKNFELLSDSFLSYSKKGYKIYVMADSPKQNERLKEILSSKEFFFAGQFIPIEKTLHQGFIDNFFKACFFTDHQIFDRFHKYSLVSDAARAGKMALTMKELQEMEYGDYVVHIDLGIGKFAGLIRVPIGNTYQEVIRLIFNNNDKVDVSIHSLYKISKYKSSNTQEPPRLSTIGTGAWDRIKERAKKKMKDIARDLIKLYAKRLKEEGFAFSPDTYMQHELEASFIYEDTIDQLKATNEVKKDMENKHPMDRLICGDVGFGKTEIAIRAAFKAATDSKQVAVLVPTTILAYQHYQTFSKRLKDFPVRIEYLSRAVSQKKTNEILEDLRLGKIDIIIGTHKLIGKSVRFKDLGLFIIDEEQKFGVSTKEKLRQLKTNVDTISMSATPIPRTLQFSLMGARDMSIIQTPPANRYPIQTELHTFNKEVIREAINFEMSRNGQIFFVNNRISNLEEIRKLIHKCVPDARIGIAHGQMKPELLEKTLLAFMDYDYDVLLSTTIVENGLDITNANTIIISDAHRFGLSDLHQMRGRVGRSNKKAFCYLLAPERSLLTDDARRRLEALETFSELGSGFNISMQDLDIRGAGNLLGAEQSGFMEDLGYETYQKILIQAVNELKSNEFSDIFKQEALKGPSAKEFVEDCIIESDLEMYLPQTYVPSDSERMNLYRELNKIETDTQIKKFKEDLQDRFGKIPHQALELIMLVVLRRMAKHLGAEKLILKQAQMRIQLVGNPNSLYYKSKAFDKVINYITSNPKGCILKEISSKRILIINNVKTVSAAVEILDKMSNQELEFA